MAEVVDSVKYPSLPSNYITLQWLKDKQREKQQENEKKEQHPFPQNHNGKLLVGKESNLIKGVDGTRGEANYKKKKKRGYFVKREGRVGRDMGKEGMMRESYKEVDRGSEGERCGVVGFKGKKNSWRKRVDVKDTTDVKVRMGGGEYCEYGDKEVASACMVVEEVVGESKQSCGVGFRGKKDSRRGMGGGVGEVSEKGVSVEQLGQVTGAYSDKEVEQVVGENKLGKECRVGFMGKKNSGRRMGDGVGRVSDKEDKAEEEVSVDVKERTNEKARVRGAFRAYSDESIDVRLIDSEANLKMKIESDLGDLSLSDRRYGHGRSSVGVYDNKFRFGNSRRYDNKWRYANSRRYEPRKMLKQKDSSFIWIKKESSSNANVAEIETQVAHYAVYPI